ncbi:hypothetical protein [Methanosphaera sp. BMS]|nr:hypothetical protein [Methanosphaera sp. BMS]
MISSINVQLSKQSTTIKNNGINNTIFLINTFSSLMMKTVPNHIPLFS